MLLAQGLSSGSGSMLRLQWNCQQELQSSGAWGSSSKLIWQVSLPRWMLAWDLSSVLCGPVHRLPWYPHDVAVSFFHREWSENPGWKLYSCITLSQKWHTIAFAVFYWSQPWDVGGGYTRVCITGNGEITRGLFQRLAATLSNSFLNLLEGLPNW